MLGRRVDRDPAACGVADLDPGGDVTADAAAVFADTQRVVLAVKPGAEDDTALEAESIGDEGRGYGELLVVTDSGNQQSVVVAADVILALIEGAEQRPDPICRMSGPAGLE